MNSAIKNMLIGVFIIVACSFLVFFVMWLKPSVGDGKKILHVYFSNINQINIGTRVTFGGRPVGEVVGIRMLPEARKEGKVDEEGEIYFYELTLKIDSHVNVYTCDEITVQTSGLLGEKSVAIVPKEPPPGTAAVPIDDKPVYANSVDPLESTFHHISKLASAATETVEEINNWIKCHGDDIGNTMRSFGAVMDHLQVTISDINDQQIIASTKDALDNFSCTMKYAQNAMDEMEKAHVFSNMGDMIENFTSASCSIEKITTDIASGKGTIGRLVTDDDFYLNASSLLSKANTMMNDINHYGLLFHLNKGWQRLRTQRADLLTALNTPSSFKNYFETEVDQIQTSMSRLSILLDRAQDNPERQKIFENEGFDKDFAELMRNVNELSDNLKLYNEQLNDAKQGIVYPQSKCN